MFPLKDINPTRTFPLVNYLLIAVTTIVFLYQQTLETPAEFFQSYALIPKNIHSLMQHPSWFVHSESLSPFVTSVFLHGGWWHFILNMWVLQIFGNNVEDSMGHFRYLLFYVLAGIAGNIGHFIFFTSSGIPLLGASGAIAGVMAAYLFLYPSSKVLTLIPILIFPLFIYVYSFVYILFWFVLQILGGFSQLGKDNASGIAFWAHLGGFLWGVVSYRFFLKHNR